MGKDSNKIKNEEGKVTTDTAEIQKTTRDYCKQPHANKMDNLKKKKKNQEILRKVETFKTEPGRKRKYELTNYKYWNCDFKTFNKQV